jgi:16S rRNA (cytosine1402-N4)-methyltransferase
MSDEFIHQPVMLHEVLDGLAIKPDGVYVDATFGRGGHSGAVLARLGAKGRLVAMDKDWTAIEFGEQTVKDPRVTFIQGSFATLKISVEALGLAGKIDGLLFDLGVSSPQLEDPSRGFSFLRDGPLDMRMDTKAGISAATWINTVALQELTDVLWQYGEERHGRRIAQAIIAARDDTPIITTGRLAGIIAAANPSFEKGKHKATRSFQGIRIFINQELQDVQEALPQALDVLAVGGRLVVISFHSLEDRIVKRFIRDMARGGKIPHKLPITSKAIPLRMTMISKLARPTDSEVNSNPRSRSARLRVAEKLL